MSFYFRSVCFIISILLVLIFYFLHFKINNCTYIQYCTLHHTPFYHNIYKSAFTLIRSVYTTNCNRITSHISICIWLNSLRFGLSFFVFYLCLSTHRDATKLMPDNLEPSLATSSAHAVCPWDEDIVENTTVSVSVCPWDDEEPPSTSKQAIAR